MMKERGLSISHTTIMRWVHQYGSELDKRIRPSIVWTCSIRYDSVRNIYALFSFTLFLHQNLKESMGKSELFEKEKIKKEVTVLTELRES
jgi:hypothetical protein